MISDLICRWFNLHTWGEWSETNAFKEKGTWQVRYCIHCGIDCVRITSVE